MSEERLETAPELMRDNFVGRDAEKETINNAISEEKNNLINIQGVGGIGKTSLLNKIHNLYQNNRILISDIVDFFDISTHTWGGFLDEVVDSLHTELFFEPYRRARERCEEIELAGVTGRTLEEEKARVLEAFKTCYAELSKTKTKIVILIDTFEVVQNRLGKWLTDNWLNQFVKTTIIIAGRKNQEWQNAFEQKIPSHYIELKELKPDETQKLFSLIQAGQIIGEEERQKLQILSGGTPILLTLALDWRYRRNIPENALTSTSSKYTLNDLKQIQAKFPKELKDIQKQFRIELVERFESLDIYDQAIQYMAIVSKWFTADMLAYIGDINEDKARSLLREMENWTFIKYNARTDSYQLHDLLRDLINEHVWNKIDSIWGERKNICKKAVEYYTKAIENINKKEINFGLQRKQSESKGDNKLKIQAVKELYYLKRIRQQYQAHRCYYAVIVDPEDAIGRWYEFSSINNIWAREREGFELIQEERNQAFKFVKTELAETYKNLEDVRINIAMEGKPDDGLKIISSLEEKNINKKKDDPSFYCEILFYKGYAHTLKGDIDNAEKILKDAITELKSLENKYISPAKFDFENILMRRIVQLLGRAYGILGYTYLLSSRFTEAIENDQEALKYAKMGHLGVLYALILNDLSYVYARMGKYERGKELCLKGLAIREELMLDYYVGLSYNTLGLIEYQGLKSNLGIGYNQKALDIFERIGELRGKGLANRALGANYRQVGREEKSMESLRKGEVHLKMAEHIFKDTKVVQEPVYLAEIYEFMGLLYQELGILTEEGGVSVKETIENYYVKSENFFKESIELYRKSKNMWTLSLVLERLFALYSLQIKDINKAEIALHELERILIGQLPEVLFIFPVETENLNNEIKQVRRKELFYPLGKLIRGKGRYAMMRYIENKKIEMLKGSAKYYTIACLYLESFSSKSRAMTNTLKEIVNYMNILSLEEVKTFVDHTKETIKQFKLSEQSEILEWIRDSTGII